MGGRQARRLVRQRRWHGGRPAEGPARQAREDAPDSAREGFAFSGWTLNGELYDFSTPVTGDITLVAGWTKKDEPGPQPEGTREMHRLYNPNSGEHFYIADTAEKDALVPLGWKYEGIGWTAPEKSSTPVYRLYNKYGGEHHYTFDASEKDALVAAGWSYEGVGWYSDDARTVPLYREYNPNAFANNNNYTTDRGEHDHLCSIGWRDEGEAWYGV